MEAYSIKSLQLGSIYPAFFLPLFVYPIQVQTPMNTGGNNKGLSCITAAFIGAFPSLS